MRYIKCDHFIRVIPPYKNLYIVQDGVDQHHLSPKVEVEYSHIIQQRSSEEICEYVWAIDQHKSMKYLIIRLISELQPVQNYQTGPVPTLTDMKEQFE
jgi:hypothetical protein